MKKTIKNVGLDVQKNSLSIVNDAYAGRGATALPAPICYSQDRLLQFF